MKSILEELYNGEIKPCEDQPHIKSTERQESLDNKVLEMLGGDENLFDELIDNFYEARDDLYFCNFKQGFILGSRFMLEVMQN